MTKKRLMIALAVMNSLFLAFTAVFGIPLQRKSTQAPKKCFPESLCSLERRQMDFFAVSFFYRHRAMKQCVALVCLPQ